MQSNAKGSVLAYSLIILSVMLLIAISLSAVTLTQTKSSLTGQNSSQAFQTADSGVQVVLKKIKKAQPTANVNSIGCSGAGIITGGLSAGTYEVQLYEYDSSSGADVPMGDCSASVGDISKIKSVGKYAGTARAVEVAVAASSIIIESGVGDFDAVDENATSVVVNFSKNFTNPIVTATPINTDDSLNETHIFLKVSSDKKSFTAYCRDKISQYNKGCFDFYWIAVEKQ